MSTAPVLLPPKTIPIIAPDGTSGQVPAANAQAAINAGGKLGIKVYAPDGTLGTVPVDQLPAALKAGGVTQAQHQVQLNTPPPDTNQGGAVNSGMRFLEGAGGALADAGKGIYNAVTAPRTPGLAGALQSLAPGGTLGYHLLVQPQIQQGQQAVQDAKSGNYSQMVGHGLAAITPGIGPAVAGTADAAIPKVIEGNYAGALGGVGANIALAALLKKASSGLAGQSTVSGQNYTPAQAAAFEGLTAKANGMGSNFIPQNLTGDALSPIRQSTADMLANGTPTEQAIARVATAGGMNPIDRLGATHSVIQKSLSDLEAQHTPALASVSGTPVDMRPIQRGLQAQIKPGMSTADISGINDLIDRAGQINNLGDLNVFRQIMNEEASPSYRQTPTRAGQASAPQQVATDTANAVRNHYFDNLQQATGTDFQPLKAQQSQLLTTKEAIERLMSPEAKAEATFNAGATSIKGRLGDLANVIKDPRTAITQTLLRESPATRVSNLIQKSLSDLPEPSQPGPAQFQGTPPSSGQPQLPANATPTTIQGTPVPSTVPAAALPPAIQRILALTRGNQ